MTIAQINNLPWIAAHWPAPELIHAGTTTRQGGVSRGRYASLNLADHVDDSPECVSQNRNLLRDRLKLPAEPAWLSQRHGNMIITLPAAATAPVADGTYTRSKHQVCAILTADCVPLLLCNDEGNEIAAIHAGWRGCGNNIIAHALKMFSAPPGKIMAWIGPCISRDFYEVGDEVRSACLDAMKDIDAAFKPGRAGHWYADLALLVKIQLQACGVGNIHGGEYCTYDDPAHFYSYRRDGSTGRVATLIWMD